MKKENNYLAIMAGGIGSRFWPVSRADMPKQFLDFLGTGKSLLQSTVKRFEQIVPLENTLIITFSQYADMVAEQLPDLPVQNIIVEPSRKNTAPTAALASYIIHNQNPEANIILSPADHMISDQHEFERIAHKALDFVDKNEAILTLGIMPSRPDTGYGYIQYNQDKEVSEEVFEVKTFTEKPNREIAESFIESGDFLWNSGLFFFNNNHFIKEFSEFQPEMGEIFEQNKTQLIVGDQTATVIEQMYPQCTNISIDNGVIEHSDSVYVIPSDFGWTDLGTWESVYQLSEKDYLDNVVYGKNVMIIDAKNSLIKASDDKLVLVQGLDHMLVIDTADVLLICSRDKEQDIKSYVQEVKRQIKGNKYM